MNELSKLPNIGKTLADKLIRIGIHSQNDLISIGSENSFVRLKTVESSTCINVLYALEGAIQGIRWHDLDTVRKRELKDFFDHIK